MLDTFYFVLIFKNSKWTAKKAFICRFVHFPLSSYFDLVLSAVSKSIHSLIYSNAVVKKIVFILASKNEKLSVIEDEKLA